MFDHSFDSSDFSDEAIAALSSPNLNSGVHAMPSSFPYNGDPYNPASMNFNAIPSRSLILQNASHADLTSSGNLAFHKLYIANIKLDAELKGLKSAHTSLLDRINELCKKTSDSMTSASTAAKLLVPESMPKFHNRKDFPLVTVWTVAEWANHPINPRKATPDISLFSTPAIQADSKNFRPSMFYLQDSQGNPVTEARATAICTMARGLFQHLLDENMAPKTWSKRSDPAAKYFYHGMVKFEPNFRLAEDSWKLERFATDIYFNWVRPRKENPTKQEVTPKIEEGSNKRKAAPSLSADLSTDIKRTKIDIADPRRVLSVKATSQEVVAPIADQHCTTPVISQSEPAIPVLLTKLPTTTSLSTNVNANAEVLPKSPAVPPLAYNISSAPTPSTIETPIPDVLSAEEGFVGEGQPIEIPASALELEVPTTDDVQSAERASVREPHIETPANVLELGAPQAVGDSAIPVPPNKRPVLVLKNPLSLRTRAADDSRVLALQDHLNIPATSKVVNPPPGLLENMAPSIGVGLSEAAAGVPIFIFSKTSFSGLNLFGQEYCHGRKRVARKEVKEAYEALSEEKKSAFAKLRQEKLDQKNLGKAGAAST